MTARSHRATATMAVLAGLMLVAVNCSGSSDVTLVLDPDCRDGGGISIDDEVHWVLDHNSDVPASWRGRGEISGTLTPDRDGGYFVADDGTRVGVTNGYRKASCSLWE